MTMSTLVRNKKIRFFGGNKCQIKVFSSCHFPYKLRLKIGFWLHYVLIELVANNEECLKIN